jgi:hypothetical protein
MASQARSSSQESRRGSGATSKRELLAPIYGLFSEGSTLAI